MKGFVKVPHEVHLGVTPSNSNALFVQELPMNFWVQQIDVLLDETTRHLINVVYTKKYHEPTKVITNASDRLIVITQCCNERVVRFLNEGLL